MKVYVIWDTICEKIEGVYRYESMVLKRLKFLNPTNPNYPFEFDEFELNEKQVEDESN